MQPSFNKLIKSINFTHIEEQSNIDSINDYIGMIIRYEKILDQILISSGYSHIVKQAISLINRRFNQKISLEEIVDKLEVSSSYFSRLFSQETGQTFSNYLIKKRIDYAKELIITTNYKLYEIGEMSGFRSPVHFNNTFKRITNMTPNQYRQEYSVISFNLEQNE